MTTRRQLEDAIVGTSHKLAAQGWVANHDGNVTARLGDGRILATPTAVHKGDVERSWLILVDDEGRRIGGTRKAFSELALHLYVYRNRSDVGAVLHSHAPAASALGLAGHEVITTLMPEPVVSLGARVPLVPYAMPKSPEFTLNLAPVVQEVDVVSLAGNGLLSWGPDLETAYLRMELVEHLAKMQLHMLSAGLTASPIPAGDVAKLLAARTKAGLGPEGRAQKVQQTVRQAVQG